ncbi:MAG: large conductance mechanosensitive channel protein MscL [Clostridiales bacterium]|nr:large conductance mechanosensitive channel protein MscL [Clostridiales bacterium]
MAKKKSTFFSDFKKFITKGNIIDLALAVVIGGAFSAIVNSLVSDIIMPLLTLATGDGVQGLSVVLNGEAKYLEDGSLNPAAVLWNYGNFLQSIINFLIIALCLFTTLRIFTKIKEAKDKLIKKPVEQVEEVPAESAVVAEVVEAPVEEKEEAPTENTDDLLRQIRDLLSEMKAEEKTTKSKK